MVGLVVEDHNRRPLMEIAKDAPGKGVGAFVALVDYLVAPAAFMVGRFGGEEVPVSYHDLARIDEGPKLRGSEI